MIIGDILEETIKLIVKQCDSVCVSEKARYSPQFNPELQRPTYGFLNPSQSREVAVRLAKKYLLDMDV